MNRIVAAAVSVPKTCARRLSTTGVNHAKTDLSHIKKKQQFFQEDNDVPIYLKGGPKDYVLFYLSVGLTVLGLGGSAHSAYSLATSK